MEDLLTFLGEVEIEEEDCFVCVVIHNIDGPGLRDFETQQYLARLAACTHIRIVASIDHVNAPLCKFSLYCHNILLQNFFFHFFFLIEVVAEYIIPCKLEVVISVL